MQCMSLFFVMLARLEHDLAMSGAGILAGSASKLMTVGSCSFDRQVAQRL